MSQHRCEGCGEDFRTLTKLRMHDCRGSQLKHADELHYEELTYTTDGVPVVVFTVDIAERHDQCGFELAMGVVEDETGDKFAFLDSENVPITKLEPSEEVISWLDAALDKGEYVTAENYEPTAEYGQKGLDYFTVAGRSIGKVFDNIDRDALTTQNRRLIERIREELAGPRDELLLEEKTDMVKFKPPLNQTDAEPVLEISICGNESRETRLVTEKDGGELADVISLTKHGFSVDTARPVETIPLKKSPQVTRNAVRLIFDDQEQATTTFEQFEAYPPTSTIRKTVTAMFSLNPRQPNRGEDG